MRIFLISLFLLPTAAFAQKACYSPSDCTGMMHCTSLDDGIVPGRCTTDARIIQKKPVKVVVKPTPKSSASSKSASVKSSSSSSVMSSAGSASSVWTDEQQSALAAAMKSMMESMASWGKGLTSMLSGMANSVKCIFGCPK